MVMVLQTTKYRDLVNLYQEKYGSM